MKPLKKIKVRSTSIKGMVVQKSETEECNAGHFCEGKAISKDQCICDEKPQKEDSSNGAEQLFELVLRAFTELWDYTEHNDREPYPSKVKKLEDYYNDMKTDLLNQFPSNSEKECVSDEEIQQALDDAFRKAGHNAYFGNGFRMGVKWVLSQLPNPTKK